LLPTHSYAFWSARLMRVAAQRTGSQRGHTRGYPRAALQG